MIERAGAGDAEEILGVHVRARADYYRGFQSEEVTAEQNRRDPATYAGIIANPRNTVLVARPEGCVAGFVILGPPHVPEDDPSVSAELYQIHVDPRWHRRGIGGALHTGMVRTWTAAGVRAARLWVWDFNDRARAFYASRGWTPDGTELPDGARIGTHRQLGYRLDLA
ncbi:GNAT family N-acetyltransferase [Amycolatopsis sp.]|uniref:GNAT family N-acetyltransferase n=1 Tax=Amycolatopsis sp. TaxID=37632 RepID=UPI002BB7C7DC|nr:GNAT family N-acetyltransferase [Amycolatopsis sp.]HVV07889.1 GNAT family N-acetyltransferase [Amycolatopsis sp.]